MGKRVEANENKIELGCNDVKIIEGYLWFFCENNCPTNMLGLLNPLSQFFPIILYHVLISIYPKYRILSKWINFCKNIIEWIDIIMNGYVMISWIVYIIPYIRLHLILYEIDPNYSAKQISSQNFIHWTNYNCK